MAAAAFADPYFLAKNFAQLMGFCYIDTNTFGPGADSSIRKSIMLLYYGGSENAAGPRCNCQVAEAENEVKCHTDACPLYCDKVECVPNCGEQCQNQIFSRSNFPATLQYQARDGFGIVLVATEGIPQGLGVLEMVGKIQIGKIRTNQPYCYPIKRFGGVKGLYLDQAIVANESRNLAFSNNPNCEIQEWVCGKQLRLLVVAIIDIQPGSVLTIPKPQLQRPVAPVTTRTVEVTQGRTNKGQGCSKKVSHK